MTIEYIIHVLAFKNLRLFDNINVMMIINRDGLEDRLKIDGFLEEVTMI